MVRVLHSVSNMDRAGIETMLMNYYRHMDRTKVQFDFLCNKKKPGAYDEEIKSLGGRIFHTPGLNPLKYPQYLSFMRKIFCEHPEYKIIEAHNGALGVYALFAAKVNHVPTRIFHAHGASITKDWKLPLKLICKAALPYTITERYTCGVAAARCYFGKRITKIGNYDLIPNAINVGNFVFNEGIREKLRRKNGLSGYHVIGHVGRFMSQKNHTFLLDVFAKLAEVDDRAKLVLLGEGELYDKIKSKAINLGINEKVMFVGNVSNANEWYQVFDCFILPSIWEGLPVVGVEAQAADLPCIFSDIITPEIALTEKAAFVNLNAPIDEWVVAIQNALQLTMRRDNTQLITEKSYNIEMEATKLQKKYLCLAGENI